MLLYSILFLKEWYDLGNLLEYIIENSTLEELNLEKNKISKFKDMKSSKATDMRMVQGQMMKAFRMLKQMRKRNIVKVCDWLYDHLLYPDEIADIIKDTVHESY